MIRSRGARVRGPQLRILNHVDGSEESLGLESMDHIKILDS